MTNLPRTLTGGHPEEVQQLMAAYPISFHCDCTGELELMTQMVRDASADLPGETPRQRFYAARSELFHCPGCGAVELFPVPGMTAYELAEEYPGWGETRGAS